MLQTVIPRPFKKAYGSSFTSYLISGELHTKREGILFSAQLDRPVSHLRPVRLEPIQSGFGPSQTQISTWLLCPKKQLCTKKIIFKSLLHIRFRSDPFKIQFILARFYHRISRRNTDIFASRQDRERNSLRKLVHLILSRGCLIHL
jgi:hypothetical protein